MKLSGCISTLALFAYASEAVMVPKYLEDGLYEIPPPTDSHLVKRVDVASKRDLCPVLGCVDISSGDTYPSGKLLKESLPLPQSKESCRAREDTMSLGNFHEAVNRLFYTPLFWLPPSAVRFSLYNGSVAYICNLGGWNAGSLVEYMDAMRILDERCADDGISDDVVRAAKLSVTDWSKFYGREVSGSTICEWESEEGGIENELTEKVKQGCKSYVNGISRHLGDEDGDCNEDAAGPTLRSKLKSLFPWYTNTQQA